MNNTETIQEHQTKDVQDISATSYCRRSWDLDINKKMEGILIVFGNKVLRKVYGSVQEMGEYRTSKNVENWELYKELNMVAVVKKRRIQCIGDELTAKGKIIKKIHKGKPQKEGL